MPRYGIFIENMLGAWDKQQGCHILTALLSLLPGAGKGSALFRAAMLRRRSA